MVAIVGDGAGERPAIGEHLRGARLRDFAAVLVVGERVVIPRIPSYHRCERSHETGAELRAMRGRGRGSRRGSGRFGSRPL